MAVGGYGVAAVGDLTLVSDVSDGSECERSPPGDVGKGMNVFDHCQVKMKTTYNTSSSNELLKAQANVLVQQWFEEYDDVMVETHAFWEAKEMLEESHSVLISGAPGDGKTAIAVHLALSLVSEGYLPVVVYSAAEVQRYCNPYEKMVFLIDDVFGKSYLIGEYLNDWVHRGQMISVLMSENIKLIFTSRNDILHECLTKLREIPAFENLIDLQRSSISLNSWEKKAIFNNLVTKYRGSNDYPDNTIDTFCIESNIIGFPATCRLLAICGSRSNPGEILNAPFTFLVREIRRISEMDETRLQYAILVLVMLYNGRLPQNLFSEPHLSGDDGPKVQEILSALGVDEIKLPSRVLANAAQASKSYIECKDGYWTFIDQATKDAVSVVFAKNHLSMFLQYAERGELYKLLDVIDDDPNNIDVPTVNICSDNYKVVVVEMTKDVLQGRHEMVFRARFLQDPDFQVEWLRYLMKNHKLRNFIQTTDEYNRTPLYYMAIYGTKNLLDCCLDYATEAEKQSVFSSSLNKALFANKRPQSGLLDAFHGAVEGRDVDVRDGIMRKWSESHGTDMNQTLDRFQYELVGTSDSCAPDRCKSKSIGGVAQQFMC